MILLIDKPKGMTSADVVAIVKKTLHVKTGHGGTLDPNATGLLIIGTEADTKKLGEITKNTNKTYEAEIVLGESRDTDDVEGEATSFAEKNLPKPDIAKIKKVLKGFEGEQMQTPPVYSAIKLGGEKAYELARKGVKFEIEPRKVTVYSIKINSFDYPVLNITCKVSSGTYIRSLARDIGEKLGIGAYLNNLRRTEVGEYKVEKAISLWQLQQKLQ